MARNEPVRKDIHDDGVVTRYAFEEAHEVLVDCGGSILGAHAHAQICLVLPWPWCLGHGECL